MLPERRRKIGTATLAVGAFSLATASIAMLAQRPNVSTTTGRLLYAGALANLSLSALWAVIALVPLRRGEPWAFWAWFLPIPVYGLPMLFFDGTNVPRRELVSTLAPQVSGLLLGVVGLLWIAPTVFRTSCRSSSTADAARTPSGSPHPIPIAVRIARWVLLGVGGIFLLNGVIVRLLNLSGTIPAGYSWQGPVFLTLGILGIAVAWIALRPGRVWPLLALAALYIPWTIIGLLGDTGAGLWPLVAGEIFGLAAVVWALITWMRDAISQGAEADERGLASQPCSHLSASVTRT